MTGGEDQKICSWPWFDGFDVKCWFAVDDTSYTSHVSSV